MTSMFDRAKFRKVIGLAESNHDAEALAAVRTAAQMARAAGMTLPDAVDGMSNAGALAAEAMRLMRRVAELEANAIRHAPEREAIRDSYLAGERVGAETVQRETDGRIRQLETELEAFRAVLPWPGIAERYRHKHRRGPKAPVARGILYRASTNQLTAEDQAELRKFVEAEDSRSAESNRAKRRAV